MWARLLIFFGVPMLILPVVFRLAVLSATAQAEQNAFAPNVEQYAHQSSVYLLMANNIGLIVGAIPLLVGIILLLRERTKNRSPKPK
jgi:hypothetical protein